MAAPRTQYFEIRYSRWLYPLMWAIGMGRRFSRVELGQDELRVRMGWAFRAQIPRPAIAAARRYRDVWWAIGVHADLRFKSWLVNASKHGIVFLDILPPAKGRSGPFRITIERLGLGLEDPEGFLRELQK